MKTQLTLLSAVCAAALLTGCGTTGMSSHEVPGVSYSSYILSLPTKGTDNTRAPIAKPLRMAVAQVGETSPAPELVKKLEAKSEYVASVVSLPAPADLERRHPNNANFETAREDFANRVQSLCRLAKTMDADYLFLCGGDIKWVHNPNFFHVFDITVVGGTIFPSNRIDVEGKASGVLLDTATAEPVLMLSTGANRSRYAPTFFTDDRTEGQCVIMRRRLAADLGDELLKKIASR